MNLRRTANLLLLIVSAGGLIAGLAAYFYGETKWAGWIWVSGSAPMLLALLVGIGRAVLRREAGLDLIALLSMAGAIALGEHLTGAVIGLMLASGRSLEDFAEGRARREMSALLSRAPRTANRYDSGNWSIFRSPASGRAIGCSYGLARVSRQMERSQAVPPCSMN